MASTELTRTPSSTTNRKTFTISYWCKRSSISSNYPRICAYDYADTDRFEHFFNNVDQMYIEHLSNNNQDVHLLTSRRFRDTSAWYHIVVAFDTTQATASNRVKLYINGVQETNFTGTVAYPSQDSNMIVNYAGGSVFYIGETGYQSGGQNFDGLMSHFHFIDGTQYAASDFGETDSTTGEWKIKTSPSVTYGTNGFFILKDGNSVTDQSGNSNNFTVSGGTLTKTEDCPSNVFATLNPLDNYYASSTFSYGNTKVVTDSSKYAATLTTLGASSGKFYAEFKLTDAGGGFPQVGIKGKHPTSNADGIGSGADSIAYYGYNGKKVIGGVETTYGDTYTTNDIIGVAMDLDNNRLFFSKNGTWQNSGDPTSSTGAITIPTSSTGFYFMGVDDEDNAGTNDWQVNFGNGYFASNAVSSAGTNASGNGIFEYDVPTGYTALSTKGLNT